MSLEQDWKTASTAFETATNQKKPSAKFLGFVNTGTSIKSALKEADAAKTPDEFRKALTKFQTASKAYTQVLSKAAADPSAVPAIERQVYVTNIAKLQAALQKIYENASKQGQDMDTAKPTAVDPKLETQMDGLLPVIGHFKTISARAAEAAPVADELHKEYLKLRKGGITRDEFDDKRKAADVKMKMVFELTKYIQAELQIYDSYLFPKS